eukprot:1156258-Pelagomonas_calceolata.AAC.1
MEPAIGNRFACKADDYQGWSLPISQHTGQAGSYLVNQMISRTGMHLEPSNWTLCKSARAGIDLGSPMVNRAGIHLEPALFCDWPFWTK